MGTIINMKYSKGCVQNIPQNKVKRAALQPRLINYTPLKL